MANTFRRENFQSATGLGYAAIAVLALIVFTSSFNFLGSVGMIAFPDATLDPEDGGGSINVSLMVVGLFALIDIPLRILCAIFFLIWLHRAYGNLSPLKAQNLEFSPGWAVGWWFIPLANLVKPFQIVRELYVKSDRDGYDDDGALSGGSRSAELVGFWWAALLLSNFAYRISDKLYGDGDLPASDYFPVAYMVGGLLGAVAGILAIRIVRSVDSDQAARISKIWSHSARADTPPPPPTFDQ
jgi:hypothetical protein